MVSTLLFILLNLNIIISLMLISKLSNFQTISILPYSKSSWYLFQVCLVRRWMPTAKLMMAAMLLKLCHPYQVIRIVHVSKYFEVHSCFDLNPTDFIVYFDFQLNVNRKDHVGCGPSQKILCCKYLVVFFSNHVHWRSIYHHTP